MNILVIGGTLFIGRLLVAELLKAGHQVINVHPTGVSTRSLA